MLAGTVSSLAPFFALTSYLPSLLDTAGTAIVVATLAIGAGQVAGTPLVPHFVRIRGPRLVLITGTTITLLAAAALIAVRQSPAAALPILAILGFAGGIAVVPQQARLFTLIPDLALVAVGLNGSAMYIASALGAGITGAVYRVAGPPAIAMTAAVLAVIGVGIAIAVNPSRNRTPDSSAGFNRT